MTPTLFRDLKFLKRYDLLQLSNQVALIY